VESIKWGYHLRLWPLVAQKIRLSIAVRMHFSSFRCNEYISRYNVQTVANRGPKCDKMSNNGNRNFFFGPSSKINGPKVAPWQKTEGNALKKSAESSNLPQTGQNIVFRVFDINWLWGADVVTWCVMCNFLHVFGGFSSRAVVWTTFRFAKSTWLQNVYSQHGCAPPTWCTPPPNRPQNFKKLLKKRENFWCYGIVRVSRVT